MEFFEALGWRWLRQAMPLLAALIILLVLSNATVRTWLTEQYQHRAERRVERMMSHLPTLAPTPSSAPASGAVRR